MFKVDKCVLTRSLSIIKPGKYRKLKDEIDDLMMPTQAQAESHLAPRFLSTISMDATLKQTLL